jgi:hypothetical protein
MEASALAQQIDQIARSISQDNAHIQPGERKRALEALIELRRLEQLRAIASGKGNSTYFFGDKAALGQQGHEAYNIDYAENIKNGLGHKAPTRVEGAM